MKQKLKRILNKYAWGLIWVGVYIAMSINYEKGYFKQDVDTFQNTIKEYNLYLTIFAVVLIIAITVLRSRSKKLVVYRLKKKLVYIGLLALCVYVNIDAILTNIALVVNKQLKVSETSRTTKIAYFDNKDKVLVLLEGDFDKISMDSITYVAIKNNDEVNLQFDVGYLGIAYNARFEE